MYRRTAWHCLPTLALLKQHWTPFLQTLLLLLWITLWDHRRALLGICLTGTRPAFTTTHPNHGDWAQVSYGTSQRVGLEITFLFLCKYDVKCFQVNASVVCLIAYMTDASCPAVAVWKREIRKNGEWDNSVFCAHSDLGFSAETATQSRNEC